MPTYQYRCTACDQSLEVVQKFTDDPLNQCPECAGKLRKVFNAVGVVFKGSGFYATDNRSQGRKNAANQSAKTETKAAPATDKAKADSSTSSSTAA